MSLRVLFALLSLRTFLLSSSRVANGSHARGAAGAVGSEASQRRSLPAGGGGASGLTRTLSKTADAFEKRANRASIGLMEGASSLVGRVRTATSGTGSILLNAAPPADAPSTWAEERQAWFEERSTLVQRVEALEKDLERAQKELERERKQRTAAETFAAKLKSQMSQVQKDRLGSSSSGLAFRRNTKLTKEELRNAEKQALAEMCQSSVEQRRRFWATDAGNGSDAENGSKSAGESGGKDAATPELLTALSSYASHLVVRRLLDDPTALQPQKLPIIERYESTVVFADISGFTPLTERMAARGREGVERLTAFLNEFFGELVSLVHEYGGDIVKFAGDAVLAHWPSLPDAVEYEALQACRVSTVAFALFLAYNCALCLLYVFSHCDFFSPVIVCSCLLSPACCISRVGCVCVSCWLTPSLCLRCLRSARWRCRTIYTTSKLKAAC